jgi:hypothetical protein
MPNASVNIGGDASGAIAAVGAVQGAIDSLSGKTVVVEVETRGGGAGGVAGLAGGLEKAGGAAEKAGRSARGMGGEFEKAGKSARSVHENINRAVGETERAGRSARAVFSERERAGAPTAAMAGHAERAGKAVQAAQAKAGGASADATKQALSAANAQRAFTRNVSATTGAMNAHTMASARMARSSATAMKAIDTKQAGDFAKNLASTTQAVVAHADAHDKLAKSATAARSAAGQAGRGAAAAKPFNSGGTTKPFSWAGTDPSSMGNTGGLSERAAGTFSRAHQKEQERAAAGPQAERPFSSGGAAEQLAARKAASGVDEVGRASEKAGGSAKSMMSALTSGASPHHIERMIRPFQEMGFQLAMVDGALAGVAKTADGMMNATTGMGMNMKGMAAGIQEAEQSAARSHNLGLNGMDQELRQSARAMTNELAPAMKAGVQATKSFEEAKMGAQASTGPELTGFANQMTKGAPALQSIMSSLGKSALNMGTDVVAGLSQTAPAFASMANSVAQNGPEIAQFAKDAATITAGVVGTAANVVGAAEDFGGSFNDTIDRATGRSRDPNRPAGTSGASRMGSALAVGTAEGAVGAGLGAAVGSVVPVVGTAAGAMIGGGVGFVAGTVGGYMDSGKQSAGAAKPSAASSYSGYRPSKDAAWANGMTGAQILTAERGAIGLGPVGSPEYSGHGTPPAGLGQPRAGAAPPVSQRGGTTPPGTFASTPGDLAQQPNASSGNPRPVAGFGSGARPMPAAMASALAPPMQSGAAAGASAGADLGGAMVQHVQKAVHTASAAASAGGQAIGGAMVGGAAQGITTNQTVTDTAIIKHLKKVQDTATGPSGIDAHSPSRKYDDLGRLIPQGLAQGVDNDSHHAFGAVQSMLGQANSFGSQSAGLGQYAYANGGAPVTINAPRNRPDPSQDPSQAPLSPMQSTLSGSMSAPVNQFGAAGMANVQRHNDRAAQLEQGREINHAIAMANLGAMNPATGQKWQDPRKADSNAGQDAAQVAHPGAHGPAPRVGGPGSTGGGAAMHASIAAGLGFHTPGLAKSTGASHGEDMAKGVTVGLSKGTASAQAGASKFAQAVQSTHRKAHGISSPATVWAGDGMNMALGVPVGFNAGMPAAAASISSAATAMSNAVAAPLNNQGLMLGYSYATNMVTRATEVLKTANFQASGTPQIANAQAQAALGQIGQLGMGAGSSVYKTPSVAMNGAGQTAQMAAALQAAVQSMPLSVTVNLDGQYVDQKIASGQNGLVEVIRQALYGTNG